MALNDVTQTGLGNLVEALWMLAGQSDVGPAALILTPQYAEPDGRDMALTKSLAELCRSGSALGVVSADKPDPYPSGSRSRCGQLR
jgi:hypothetical protein